MADIPQEVREAAARLATASELRPLLLSGEYDDHPYIELCHAMFIAGKRAGMERAAEIADDHARNAWAIGQQEGQNDVCSSGRNHGARDIAQAIRSENDA